MTRRNFVQATGAASLAQAAAAQISTGNRSPNDRIQVAAIGFGIMGQGDVETAVSIPGVELVAVCDVYDGRLTLARERYGDQVFTTRDYREILARPEIDAVIVATPDHWHDRISIDAMAAGKDVYCQKPMVQRVEDGAAVIEAQKRTGRILQVGSQRVSSVLYQKARDLVRRGALGQIHMVEAWIDRNSAQGAWMYSIPPDASPQTVDWDRFLGRAEKRPFEAMRLFRWRNYREYGTGIAGDLFVHLFSGIHFVLDSMGPTRILASGGTYFWKDGRDVPDLMVGVFDYPATDRHPGFQLNLRVNFESAGAGAADGQGFRFVGTEGILNLSVGNAIILTKRPRETAPGHSAKTFSTAVARRIIEDYRAAYPDAPPRVENMLAVQEERFNMPRAYSEQTAHHEAFFAAVRSRQPVIEDAEFGLRAAGPAVLANASYFEQEVVLWDPVKMVVKG